MQASDFLKKLKTLSKEDLIEVKGIGEVLAENFASFVDSPRYEKLLEDFEELKKNQNGIEIIETQKSRAEGKKLSGKTVCITGKFNMPRPQIKNNLEDLGAKVTNTVSSKTDFLLAGEDSGSKLQKAESLDVKIVRKLEDLIEEGGALL